MTPSTIPDSAIPYWRMAVGLKVICGPTINVVAARCGAKAKEQRQVVTEEMRERSRQQAMARNAERRAKGLPV